MAGYATKRTLMGLFKQACHEYPEHVAAASVGCIGLGISGYIVYDYFKNDGHNKPYKYTYIVLRPDDPKASSVHEPRIITSTKST